MKEVIQGTIVKNIRKEKGSEMFSTKNNPLCGDTDLYPAVGVCCRR